MFEVRMAAAILAGCKQLSAGGGGSGFGVDEAVAVVPVSMMCTNISRSNDAEIRDQNQPTVQNSAHGGTCKALPLWV
jgi:hypothetical protein